MIRWAVLALLAIGCAGSRVPRVGEAPPVSNDKEREKQWQATVAKYTDRDGIYDGLDTRMFVAATWQAPAFVEARMARNAEFQALPAADAKAQLEAEQSRLSDSSELFVGVHLNDPKYDDFDRPGSVWRMTLTAAGQQLGPKEVIRVGRSTLPMRGIYPYMDDFWIAYRVRFPKVTPTPGSQVKLRIASALGMVALEFPAQ